MAIDDLVALENKIEKEYGKASKDLVARWDEYINGSDEIIDGKLVHHESYAERWEKEHKAMIERKGNYANLADPEAHFRQWELNQIGRGDHWLDMKEQMVSRITETNQIASQYINNELPKAYTKESNSIASLAEKSAMEQGIMGIRFDLVDESTIRNLMTEKDNVISFKTTKVNPKRDYEWNDKKIQNALTQGILQGDSITRLANRFLAVMKSNESAAIRNARTSMTSARNAGKQDRFDDLAEKGCEITKIWVATHDERVRDWHIEADGQEVPYDEPFIVGDDEMMYPCDPSASPANVYNCRCTMKTGKIVFKSIRSANSQNIDKIEIVGDNNSIQMPSAKNSYMPNYSSQLAQGTSNAYYDEIHNRVINCSNDDLTDVWKKYEDQIGVAETNVGRAYCDWNHNIHINMAQDAKGKSYEAPYQVTFHEAGHAIDMITRNEGNGTGYYYSSTYQNGLFPKTIKDEVNSWVNSVDKYMKADFKAHKDDADYLHNKGYIGDHAYNYKKATGDWLFGIAPSYSKSMAYKAIENSFSSYSGIQKGDISDILEGATNGRISIGYGHGASYWKNAGSLGTEAFAEMTSATMANSESVAVIKQFLPKSYSVYEKMIADLNK